MLNLAIEDLKPGMILARPVRNRQGVLLLEAGARITKKNIRIFKSWGVNEVIIQGRRSHARRSSAAAAIADQETIVKQLKDKFSDVLDDPVMIVIYNAAKSRLLKE
ncbi:MAG: hypothetical protein QNJ58_24500 [Desulfobacterales bacterium]|nr:hypothetical protein [Desulfobacterales bacterium]